LLKVRKRCFSYLDFRHSTPLFVSLEAKSAELYFFCLRGRKLWAQGRLSNIVTCFFITGLVCDMVEYAETLKETCVAWISRTSRLRAKDGSATLAALVLGALLPTMPAGADGTGRSTLADDQINWWEHMMLASDMAPEPDYEAVMAKEFRGAVEEGTSAALLRFIARHPDHPLANRARELLAGRKARDEDRSSEPDADIYGAFEDARRKNSIEAFEAFAERYAGHPLSVEAKRRIEELRLDQ
jgi:hypothetical protein